MSRLNWGIGLAGAFLLLSGSGAFAHGFAGARFFPATLASDDPFVADELSLPTVSLFKEDDVRTETYSVDFAKRLTRNLGIELGESYLNLHPQGARGLSGFDNLELGAKYQFLLNPTREMILSAGLELDVGGTGAKRIGA